MSDKTENPSGIECHDPMTETELLDLVYDQLRALAARSLAGERAGPKLDATELVHEAYLRVVASSGARTWDSRGHFFAAVAMSMRRILIDQARRRSAAIHGGKMVQVDLAAVQAATDTSPGVLLALHDALSKLEAEGPTRASLIRLRFFQGLTQLQAADILGMNRTTAHRHWQSARLWLHAELRH